MLTEKELTRYNRHLLLPEIGIDGQTKLKQARVLVVGAGGLGCPVLSYITAAGVGEIGIIDFDTIDESNLQRQILFSQKDVGKSKAEIALQKLSLQNPLVKFNAYPVRLDTKNALDIFSGYDIIVDGTDNFSTRYLINDACVLLNKTLVHGSIYRFEGQVSVFNHTDKSGEPGPTYRCLFPEPPSPGDTPGCSVTGVLGVLPGIVGCLQVNEVIKLITGAGSILSGKLLMANALTMEFNTLEIRRDNNVMKDIPKNAEEFLKKNYDIFCGIGDGFAEVKKITATELSYLMESKHSLQLIDVREYGELPDLPEITDDHIPVGAILEEAHRISRNKKVILFCQTGSRSKYAIELLQKKYNFSNLYDLEGGVVEWIKIHQKKTTHK